MRPSSSSPLLHRARGRRLLAAHAWLVYGFLYLPIVVLVAYSFNANRLMGRWTGWSLIWYGRLWRDPAAGAALRNSLVVASLSTLVATMLGTTTALALERFRFRGRTALDGILHLSIAVPDITLAVMLLLFFARAGQVWGSVTGRQLEFGLVTITLSHVSFSIAFVALVVRARLAAMDRVLEEAAADLYATPWQTFRWVTWPLLRPGVLGGALLAFTLSLDDVVVTSFVSGPGATTLPVYLFGLARRSVTPMVNAIATLMIAASMLLVFASLALQRGRD